MGRTPDLRRARLQELITQEPFLTDAQLAESLGVSVATIRLDRHVLQIPELRARTRAMAAVNYSKLRSMGSQEVIGELVSLDLGTSASSLLHVTQEMVLQKSKVARGHHLFAQSNSLAAAVLDAPGALTASATVRFLRPVSVGERVLASATVTDRNGSRYCVSVESRVHQDAVFTGRFWMVPMEADAVVDDPADLQEEE